MSFRSSAIEAKEKATISLHTHRMQKKKTLI